MAFLGSFGAYLPSRIVTNAEVAQIVGCDAGWIQRTSGIETRRYAAEDETVVDLAVAAARRCLAKPDPRSIGLVLVASGSGERRFPGPATRVAHALNLGSVPALDLAMPSAGGLIAIALASQLVTQYGEVLVIAAEKMSSIVQHPGTNPQVAVLFGDGAGACLVSGHTGAAQVLDSALYSDGAFDAALHMGFSDPMQMDGRTVIMQAARKMPQAIAEILQRNNTARDDVGTFLLHQANQNLIGQVAKTLDVSSDKFFSNVSRYGNTSSASLLIAAAEWSTEGGFAPGVPVVLAAFGAGLQWGAVLLVGRESEQPQRGTASDVR
jgi:3-oxoacyl-[acyl-carrier-protein] synthase-3